MTVRTILVLAAAWLALAGQAAASGQRTRTLASRLLAVGQMPTGWSVDNSPGSGIGCLSQLFERPGLKQTASARVSFLHNGSLPTFGEKLATYADGSSRAFAVIVAWLNRCKTTSGTSDGHKATATIGAMSFPRFGDQSAAFAATLHLQGVTAGEDLLIVRKGNVVAGLVEGDIGSPDLSQFERLVRKAVATI